MSEKEIPTLEFNPNEHVYLRHTSKCSLTVAYIMRKCIEKGCFAYDLKGSRMVTDPSFVKEILNPEEIKKDKEERIWDWLINPITMKIDRNNEWEMEDICNTNYGTIGHK